MKNLLQMIFRLHKAPGPKSANAYDVAKQREIENYKELKNIHDLPAIFHYWKDRYLQPNFLESGFSGIDEFFAKNLLLGAAQDSVFLSVGAGYCDTEMRIAKLMKEMGLKTFKFECLELNPHLIRRAEEMAEKEGLSGCMEFTEADFNEWRPKRTYSGVMANHSLHHVVKLESLFDNIYKSLSPDGVFVVNDMIGRNGHQRWPEALEVVNQFWGELPEAYRYNHQLQRVEPEFVNWDCSTEGFEGIRAQDILPLLVEHFKFKYFYGFANVIGPFIDRGFGHNFDAAADWDRAFIDRLHEADEEGFQSGRLKPTQMLAVMTKSKPSDPFYVRGLSPESSVRHP
jgi:SAM-dependent methyltransferase